MDVPAAHPVEQLRHLVGQWNLLSLHKEDAFVLERTGPVHVNLQLASNVLGNDQQLRKTCRENRKLTTSWEKMFLFKFDDLNRKF